MKVALQYDEGDHCLRLSAVPDEHDLLEKFSGEEVVFWMPPGWSFSDAHPDVLALTAIIVLHPFVGKEFSLGLPVSDAFRAACAKFLPYQCCFADSSVPSRKRVVGVPGLSFSGGVDSTAALALMPRDSKAFFLDRVTREGTEPAGLYVKDSAAVACGMIERLGYEVHRIRTNMEYVRRPVGFPIDWASGAPALLMADHSSLSSISWGVVAESGYRVGHENFIDFPKRTIFARWNGLLSSVGLSLGAPVAGLSEVATSLIVERSHLSGASQSCIRGEKDKPCLNCFKCLRKTMLDAALQSRTYSVSDFEKVVRFRGGRGILLGLPIKHENVFRWIVENIRMSGPSETWEAFKARLKLGGLDVAWAPAWYPPSADLIPEEYREGAIAAILSYVPRQTEAEQAAFAHWDMREILAGAEARAAVSRLDSALG